MPEYRRVFIPGGTFFFTLVTNKHRPILVAEQSRKILRAAFLDVMGRFPFTIDAICLLPDHLHCIWTLPDDDANYSIRWKEIKRLFSREYVIDIGVNESRNMSQQKRAEAAVWQRRFWEHFIRDEEDFRRHVDYIHYNPVKHGLVPQVCDWPWSSFQRYVKLGFYDASWGENEIKDFAQGMSYGE